MPERRIDAIGKTDASAWNGIQPSKGSSHLLKVISGQLSDMPTGKVMRAVVQKATNGAFKITLNGELFIIRGLPASLLGKVVSFVNRQTVLSGKGGAELFWLGQGREKNTSTNPVAQQGQNFAVRIQPGINSKATLEILPQQQINQPIIKTTGKALAPLQMASFTLSTGDITPAVVQKRLSNGHVQLNIQGVMVETPAPASITQGDLLTLRMTKPPAEFQLISVEKDTAEKAMAVVKNNLPVSYEPLTQTITAIRNLMPAILTSDIPLMNGIGQLEGWLSANASDQQQPVTGERLTGLIRNSGAGLEAKLLSLTQQSGQSAAILQDLKTIFLQLSNIQSTNVRQASVIKILSELSRHGAARIETTQALNVLAHIHSDPIRFELPMLVGQQLVNVQMSMQQQGQQTSESAEGEESKQAYSVLFALELNGLGNMKVDASISDRSVHARIYSDQAGVSQFIRDHIQRLETRLQDLGYKEVFLLSSRTAPDNHKQQRFNQLTNMAPASLNLLDVIV